jgi:hypothetical protein
LHGKTAYAYVYEVKYCFVLSITGNRETMKFSKQFQLYESEATQFINSLKQANSKLEQGQRDGRALLWDKEPLDLDKQRRIAESTLEQQAYVYQNKH